MQSAGLESKIVSKGLTDAPGAGFHVGSEALRFKLRLLASSEMNTLLSSENFRLEMRAPFGFSAS